MTKQELFNNSRKKALLVSMINDIIIEDNGSHEDLMRLARLDNKLIEMVGFMEYEHEYSYIREYLYNR